MSDIGDFIVGISAIEAGGNGTVIGGIGDFIIGISAIGEGDTLLDKYLDLITSEHNQQPKFMAMLAGIFQPLVDGQLDAVSLNTMFDLDTAAGEQLDIIGLWIGVTRYLRIPVTNVYFTYNNGPGYNRGIYKGPFDPITGLTALPDAQYRTLLKATAASNQWNGTIPGAYAAYAILFAGTPFSILIYDYQNMQMAYALIGGVPDALTQALFTEGYLALKPDGVRVNSHTVPVNPNAPVWAYNFPAGPKTAGYNVGAYAKSYSGS